METWLPLDGALLQARLPGRLRKLLAGTLQQFEERRNTRLRRRLLELDRDLDRRLSFAPVAEGMGLRTGLEAASIGALRPAMPGKSDP